MPRNQVIDQKTLQKWDLNLNSETKSEPKKKKQEKFNHWSVNFVTNFLLDKSTDAIHEGERPFKFEQCSNAFNEKAALQYHIYALHTGKKPFACKHCKQVFRSKNRLEKHEIVREPKQTRKIESLKCEFCDKLFNRPEHRRNHVKQVHEEEMPFKCEQCSKAFKEQAALQKHIYVLHTGKKTICM